jgi:hypothetical protein
MMEAISTSETSVKLYQTTHQKTIIITLGTVGSYRYYRLNSWQWLLTRFNTICYRQIHVCVGTLYHSVTVPDVGNNLGNYTHVVFDTDYR